MYNSHDSTVFESMDPTSMRPFVCQRSVVCVRQAVQRVAGISVVALLGVLFTLSALAQDGTPTPADPGPSGTSDVAVRAVMIPTDFQQGKYSVMIQVAVDG